MGKKLWQKDEVSEEAIEKELDKEMKEEVVEEVKEEEGMKMVDPQPEEVIETKDAQPVIKAAELVDVEGKYQEVPKKGKAHWPFMDNCHMHMTSTKKKGVLKYLRNK